MKNGRTKRVLVVDDDSAILEAIKVVLEDNGYDVLTSVGDNVIEIGLSKKPDLILLDYWLPKKNGDLIISDLKSQIRTQDIPVVLISANQDIKKVSRISGATDFLTKPFEIDELLSKVEKYIAS